MGENTSPGSPSKEMESSAIDEDRGEDGMPMLNDDKEYHYFDEDFERFLKDNSFKGAVDDWTVIDSDFRRRAQSSLGSYDEQASGLSVDRENNNSRNSGEWVIDKNDGDSEILKPKADSRRLSLDPLGIMSGDGAESYVEFFCRLTSDNMTIWLFRRFSDFEKFEAQLRKALKADKSAIIIPALPAKQVFSFSGRWKEKKFVEQRRQLLDAWIKAVFMIQSKGGKNVQEAFKAFVQG